MKLQYFRINFITIIIMIIVFTFALATYERTKIADYDIKLAHYQMSEEWNYCPYCGECLRSEDCND